MPAVFVAAVAVLVFVTSLPTMCPLRLVLGVPCPSCGLTRAARLALGGNLRAATRMHPLWFLVLPYVGGIAGVQLSVYLRRGEFLALENRTVVKRTGQVLLAALVALWTARFFGAFGGPCPV